MSEVHWDDSETVLDALLLISSRLDSTDVVWALTGSLGHALQGVPVEVHDIDLQTDESGAYAVERSLSEYAVRPVAHSQGERIRSHFGVFEVRGVRVEVMGALQKRPAEPIYLVDDRATIMSALPSGAISRSPRSV